MAYLHCVHGVMRDEMLAAMNRNFTKVAFMRMAVDEMTGEAMEIWWVDSPEMPEWGIEPQDRIDIMLTLLPGISTPVVTNVFKFCSDDHNCL